MMKEAGGECFFVSFQSDISDKATSSEYQILQPTLIVSSKDFSWIMFEMKEWCWKPIVAQWGAGRQSASSADNQLTKNK